MYIIRSDSPILHSQEIWMGYEYENYLGIPIFSLTLTDTALHCFDFVKVQKMREEYT